jgi:hypothetical protein
MAVGSDEMSTVLPCHVCGYDLRAHAQDGICPECGATVAEARKWAAVPLRPAWRESDPRWRRRMVAGAWVLVLLPLMEALQRFGWAAGIRVPSVFEYLRTVPLDGTLASWPALYQPLVFCIGVVLLFSKERGRRREPLDWTRRWGVLCSYVVLLLSAVSVFFTIALVLAGMSAVFLSMPRKYQPGATHWLVDLSTAYIRYGPHPNPKQSVVLVACSSITILLACAPLYDAFRSRGSHGLGLTLLAPLGLFSLLYVWQAVLSYFGRPGGPPSELAQYEQYFCPQLLIGPIRELPRGLKESGVVSTAFVGEAIKWCMVLAVAIWLSLAPRGELERKTEER